MKNSQATKNIATPKQTSGSGFAFEDKVVAYYLVWMLVGKTPFGLTLGAISQIDCQVHVDGWLLDDLLLTITHRSQKHRYACSIKSNVQFSKNTAPSDFVEIAWSQYLHEVSGVFDHEFDMMGLICIPQPDPPRQALHGLLRKAYNQTPEQLDNRINVRGYASSEERNLYNSFACPKNLVSKHVLEKCFTGELLRRIAVLELDFETNQSKDEATAVFLCSELLTNGSQDNAFSIWTSLCQIAQRLRNSGGGSTRQELLNELKETFEFRDLPDFSEDWFRLRSWCQTELDAVPDHIGGIIQVERPEVLEDVLLKLSDNNFLALVGESGTGKSVISKWVAAKFMTTGDVLWFNGGRLRSGYLETFASHQGLSHTLKDVLSNGKYFNGLVVLDSSERLLSDDDFKEAVTLLHLLGMDNPGCTWRILATCRAEEWERVQFAITRNFGQPVSWTPIRLRNPISDQLQPVWQAFPPLRILALRPHLRDFMFNPKVLDILAVAITSGHDLANRSWVGESDVIKWYWRTVIREGAQGTMRSALLQKIAELEADSGRFELAETELTQEELALLPGLRGIIRVNVENATIAFSHDLLADWARLQLILSYEATLSVYLRDRLTSPHWNKAVRLYGVSVLEQDPSATTWRKRLEDFPGAHNLLIEALIFAGNSQQLLENAWSMLIAEDGKLLRDLLNRFLHVATIPNPDYFQLVHKFGITESEARTLERLPLWMYWLGMLRFLALHIEEVVGLVKLEIARIAFTWLRYTPLDWPGRGDAATLALATGWHSFRIRPYHHRSKKDKLILYRAALEAYSEKPTEVKEFALKAASRVKPSEEDGEPYKDFKPPGTVTYSHSRVYGGERISQEPWQDGPLYRVDDLFRRTCLDTDALRGIMVHDPELASEVILALLIEVRPPRFEIEYDEWSILPGKDLGFSDDIEFYPRFYTRGPFLLFLRTNPEYALKTIIKLIDFATERRIESHYDNRAKKIGVDITLDIGKKHFIGDSQTYHWYHSISDSNIVTSALMAVEKWLYELIDNNESVGEWISMLLEGKSLAFIGLLSEVGRYKPELFTTFLKPLLLTPDTYYHETLFRKQGGYHFGTPFSWYEGEWFWKLAREWDTMEHRHRRLSDISAYLFHLNKEMRNALITAKKRWIDNISSMNEQKSKFVENLSATFDPANWKEVELSDGTTGLAFQTPETLRPSLDQIDQHNKQLLLLNRPIECRSRINDGKRLDDDQIINFLNQAKTLSDYKSDDPKLDEIAPSANAICGTIAVLVRMHRDWLRENPSKERWCIEKLTEIIENPPRWPELDSPESIIDHTWEHFAAEVIPLLLAEQPNDKKWWQIIAQLVMTKHYNASGILMNRAFEKRVALGESFWQLVNLFLDWAAIRYSLRKDPSQASDVNAQVLRRKLIKKFTDGKYPDSMPPWGEVSLKAGKLRAYGNLSTYHSDGKRTEIHPLCRESKLDIEQIRYGFANIFLPEQSINQEERNRFLNFWDQALITALTHTKFYDKNGNELDPENVEVGLPFEYDNWVLETLAIVIVQMHLDEQPERYWQPILVLGSNGEHWIERFLIHWFKDAKRIAKHERFLYHWRQMLEFCLSSVSWTGPRGPSSYHIPKLWLCSIGIPNMLGSLWTEDDQDIISAMDKYFVQIAPHIYRDRYEAIHLINWLSEPSSKPIRLQMLAPLSVIAKQASDYWWEEHRLTTAIARYLNLLWDGHHIGIKSDSEMTRIFDDLLHETAARHDPLALELQTRISSR